MFDDLREARDRLDPAVAAAAAARQALIDAFNSWFDQAHSGQLAFGGSPLVSTQPCLPACLVHLKACLNSIICSSAAAWCACRLTYVMHTWRLHIQSSTNH